MKVLHATVMSEPAIGVINQLIAEQAAAKALGIEWDSILYTSESIDADVIEVSTVDAMNRVAFKKSFYNWVLSRADAYDVILLRHSASDPIQLSFLWRCKTPVCLVHHTLEIPELSLNSGLKNKLKQWLELFVGPASLTLASGCVAVTDEILQYELSRRWSRKPFTTHVYPNGIEYFEPSPALPSAPNNEVPTLLFVSSKYAPWQGLKELIASAEHVKEPFVCHVVGELSNDQLKLAEADQRFIVHGTLKYPAIEQLIHTADIGLSALELMKKKMKSASTLKVREYLRAGLAVYGGYNEVFPADFPFFHHGPNDMSAIVEYAKKRASTYCS